MNFVENCNFLTNLKWGEKFLICEWKLLFSEFCLWCLDSRRERYIYCSWFDFGIFKREIPVVDDGWRRFGVNGGGNPELVEDGWRWLKGGCLELDLRKVKLTNSFGGGDLGVWISWFGDDVDGGGLVVELCKWLLDLEIGREA